MVRYDHSLGDKFELRSGHGTKVAGAAAGKAISNMYDKANGIAQGSKLHVFDMMQGSGMFVIDSNKRKCPSLLTFVLLIIAGGYNMLTDLAYKLFESMHSTRQRPARVAVGSFNTNYRAYPFSCKFFDEALNGRFKGDIFVTSAGNDGLNKAEMKSKARTIGNPASCKNTLAGEYNLNYEALRMERIKTHFSSYICIVGASQSHGIRLSVGAEGVDYVAAFSSRSLKQVQVSRPWIGSQELEEVREYDDNQGMGLIQLDNTLPIPDHNSINAIVRNDIDINDGDFHDIFIKATPNECVGTSYIHDFSATLAWYDPAGSTNCTKCLVNDLDIMVHEVRTNGSVKGGTKMFPNGLSRRDHDNNVERIRFKMSKTGRYRIRIKATNIDTKKASFSMIASGCFKEVSYSKFK